MPDALVLLAALLCNLAGLGWLALAMDVHWEQVHGPAPLTVPALSRATLLLLRGLGCAGLATALALCLRVDHGSMAALVWIMSLAGAALLIAFTLSWRAFWLRPLVPWVRRRAVAGAAREDASSLRTERQERQAQHK